MLYISESYLEEIDLKFWKKKRSSENNFPSYKGELVEKEFWSIVKSGKKIMQDSYKIMKRDPSSKFYNIRFDRDMEVDVNGGKSSIVGGIGFDPNYRKLSQKYQTDKPGNWDLGDLYNDATAIWNRTFLQLGKNNYKGWKLVKWDRKNANLFENSDVAIQYNLFYFMPDKTVGANYYAYGDHKWRGGDALDIYGKTDWYYS